MWTVWIDIYVLDHDGNLTDAASIGTLAALMTTKIPKAEVTEDEQVTVDKTHHVGPLPLRKKVVTVSIGKIKDVLIVDPDQEEESILDSKIVIAVDEEGVIAGIQKAGLSSISREEALKAADVAIEKGTELIKKITEMVTSGKPEEGKAEEEVAGEKAEEEAEPEVKEAEEEIKKEEAPAALEEREEKEEEKAEKPEEEEKENLQETESLKPSE